MKNSDLQIVAPDKKQIEQLIDLGSKVFSNRGYYVFREHCSKGYLIDSHYDWNVSRIGIMDGRMVTHFGVWDFQMRIGGTALRVGGVGLVATDGEYRNRGLMSKTVWPVIDAMRQAGYDLSLLYGKENFYHRYNYVRAWSDTNYTVGTADLPGERIAGLKRFKLVHDPRRADLYNRQNAGLTGTAVRPTFMRAGSPLDFQGYQWLDDRGRLAGYVVVMPENSNPGRLLYVDGAGQPADILRAVGQLARKADCKEVRFRSMHERSELARLIRRGNVRVEISYRRNGSAMASIINLRSCMDKIAPQLSLRLAASTLAAFKGQLLISDGREKVVLDIARGKVSVGQAGSATNAIRGGDRIVQLILGTAPADEVFQADDMKVTGRADELAEVLFPPQQPILSLWDYF